ncbi:MAG: apolipoprotein N-acyltransferase, partial [Candidatus Humimicrobiaceae bacterium]
PYFTAISKSNLKTSILLSWLTGIVFFAGVTYWFTNYSFVFWFPILGLLSIFFIFYGAIFWLIYSKVRWPFLRIFLISSIWISVEFLRHRTFLAFPWGVMGYSQHNYLPLMQISKLTGVLGVSLLIILFNLCMAEIIIHFTCKRAFKFQVLFSSVAIVVLVASNALFGSIYFKGKDKKYLGEKLDVAIVQPNISFDDKFETGTAVLIPDKTGSRDKYFAEGTDLVVYPESVIWGDIELERNKEFRDWVKNTAQKENLYFLMGQILWNENEEYFNTVQLYSPDLKILGRYNKIHPLPCAEYMPYPKALGFLSFMNIAKLNITPANQVILIEFPGKGEIGSNICFESTLQIISRTYRKSGANVLLTLTDTAGFKNSIVAWHHIIFSRVRAIENNSFMIHSGNNGISAVIDPDGRILIKTELVKKEVIYGSIYFDDNKSFYSIHGELILYLYYGIVFILLLFYLAKVKRAG